MSKDEMAAASYLSSPDEVSPYYPDRFIRPLPKRSIRSRLSQEAAESIAYPPNPPSASLPPYSHYDYEHDHDHDHDHSHGHDHDHDHDHDHEHEHDHDHDHDHEHDHDHDHDHDHRSFHEDDEHDHDCPHHPHHHHHHHHHHCHHHEDEDDELDSVDEQSPIAQRTLSAYRSSPRSPRSHRHSRYGSYGGKSSGPDGYEAFENTNNKKKRKIPTSGSLSLHQSSLNSEFANMGLLRDGVSDEMQPQYSTSPSGLGVQGAGRGRNSRKAPTRNPLGPSTNGTNVRTKYDYASAAVTGDDGKADQGIISKAIANATTLLRNPLGRGQENVGVLDQQTKTTPTNSQFTFTCEADAKGVKFPEQSLYSPDYAQRVATGAAAPLPPQTSKSYAQGTQTGAYAGANSHAQPMSTNQPAAAPHPGQKQRRKKKGSIYSLAAKQRRLQQECANVARPPEIADIWLCEFCEYETIFGASPRALVRQYEIKDRAERKRLAEKRRLLEKAKLKGRKGKKQTKNATKAANAASQQSANNQNYDNQSLDQMDDYLDDGYDDDPLPMPDPPPAPAKQQSMPGAYNTGQPKAGGGIAGGGTAGTGTAR